MKKFLCGFVSALTLVVSAHAQTPSVARMGMTVGSPQHLKVFDNTGTWVDIGSVTGHVYLPSGIGPLGSPSVIPGAGVISAIETNLNAVGGLQGYLNPGTGVLSAIQTNLNTVGGLQGYLNPGTGVISAIQHNLNTPGGLQGYSHALDGTFSPADLGAVCDGTTDDRVAIQAAETAAQSFGGGNVIIPISANGCRDTTTLNITASNISIRGIQKGGSKLLFDNGTSDSIVIGNGEGTSQIDSIDIKNLTILHANTKLGGIAVALKFVARFTMEDVKISNMWSGLLADQTNSVVLSRVIMDALTNSGGIGVNYSTIASSSSVRSDILNINDSSINMHATSKAAASEGVHIDGFSNDLRIKSLDILQVGGIGFHVLNSSHSSLYYPSYCECYDVEIDGQYSTALKIEGGVGWLFDHAIINSVRNTDPTEPIVLITPDTGNSVTRAVNFSNSSIVNGPGECVHIQGVQNSIFTGNTIADCGKYAGANGLGGATAPVPVMELGAAVSGFSGSNNILGYIFGQCCSGSNNYSVKIDNGAQQIVLGDNNYFLFNGTVAAIDNLANLSNIVIMGGLDYNGGPYGVNYTDGGTTGRSQIAVVPPNGTVSSTSGSQFSAASVTASAFTLMTNLDGVTPKGIISTGVGDTGGLTLRSAAGALNLVPDSGDINLIPPAGNIQIAPSGKIHFGSAVFQANGGGTPTFGTTLPAGVPSNSPTEWIKYIDDAGHIFLSPSWQCTSGC